MCVDILFTGMFVVYDNWSYDKDMIFEDCGWKCKIQSNFKEDKNTIFYKKINIT